TATSNSITVSRTANVTPTVSIALTSGSNPGCAGTSLTFTASQTNGGAAPGYQWKVNNINTGTNTSTFSSSSLANTDVVSCVLTSNASCVISATSTSNDITMIVDMIPTAKAGSDQYTTSSSFTMSANTPVSGATGTWSTTGSASIFNLSD